MIKAIYDLDMTPMRTLPIIINVSQYDDLGRILVFNLFSSSGKWTAPTSAAVTFEGGKPDGKFFSYNCAYSSGTVTVTIQQQMTAVAGKVRCKIKVTSGDKVVESAPIIMVVDAAAVPDGSDMSKSDINDAVANATQKIIDQVKDTIPSDYAQLSTDVSSLKQDINYLPIGNLDIMQNVIANELLSKTYTSGIWNYAKGKEITLQPGKYVCVVYDAVFSSVGYFVLSKNSPNGGFITNAKQNNTITEFSLSTETLCIPIMQISTKTEAEKGDYHLRYSIYSADNPIIPEEFTGMKKNSILNFCVNGILISGSGKIDRFSDSRLQYVVTQKIRCSAGLSVEMHSKCLNSNYTCGLAYFDKNNELIQLVEKIGSYDYTGTIPENAFYCIAGFDLDDKNSYIKINGSNVVSTVNSADTAQATADTAQATAVKKIKSKNLFDKDDTNISDNCFIDSNGKLVANEFSSSYFATDYILINGDKPYSISPAMRDNIYIAFYDKLGKFISAVQYGTNKGSENIVSPSNARLCRFTGIISKKATTMLEENEKITSFEKYIDYLPLNILTERVDTLSEELDITVRQETQISKADSMADRESIQLDVPDIKQNNRIAFYGKLGSFSSITISHGITAVYASGYIVVDNENVSAYSYTTQEVLNGIYSHGLTFKDFVSVEIKVNNNLSADVTITTGNGGIFTKNIKWNGNRDAVKATVTGGTLTDCALTFRCNDYSKDVWAFGDSYFDMWPLKVNALGAKNWLVDGYSGRSSNAAYASLEKCLMHGKPKYVLWCMGMNDPDSQTAINSAWKNCAERLIALCESKNIIPIFCTVPTCTGGQVADTDISKFRNHAFKNAYIRDSGYRYVDIAKAVGSNDSDGTWYTGMLSGDGVHPAGNGQQAIAYRIIADVPEVME